MSVSLMIGGMQVSISEEKITKAANKESFVSEMVGMHNFIKVPKEALVSAFGDLYTSLIPEENQGYNSKKKERTFE